MFATFCSFMLGATRAVLKSVHASLVNKERSCKPCVHSGPSAMVMCMSNSTSESQDEDSMMMRMPNSHSDAVISFKFMAPKRRFWNEEQKMK
jgi:hypothetical protein